jgi:biotin-dependent carboxylase-like uncharacterized protein
VSVTVLDPGPLTTVQDLGRPGHRALGVGSSGAADRPALCLGNRLVGNPEGAAALEVTLGGLRLRADAPVVVAVTGAPTPATVDGSPAPTGVAVRLAPGATLALGQPPVGLRTYLAVRGGIDLPPVLGSRASDLLGGLGPPPVAVGTTLPVGTAGGPVPAVDVAPLPPLPAADEEVALRVAPGPHLDRVTGGLTSLGDRTWTVTSDSDRTALRLTGAPLARDGEAEVASCGLLPGAVQAPADGQPIVFLADAPATGGYPVIAVLVERDQAIAAQLRSGQRVRFAPVSDAARP